MLNVYTQILQMYSHRIRWIWGSLLVLMFMVISISNMDHFLQYSIYYWLWLFLSLNDALLVLQSAVSALPPVTLLVCGTAFSSCVWHSTCRYFDVLLANCVSSGVGCWASETTLTWPFLWVRVEYTMCCMWIWCEFVLMSACLCEENVRWCVSVYACIYAEGRFLWVTHSQSWALNILWAPVSEKDFFIHLF